ncbi:DUF2313 domain-containing protein [Jeongeupia wiesaeckerbachi]|uniref:YmfQ family protein n=1 Tax=Jeongeupia wiesaeckerbachi TaxID=3051218 RepID=UPI003D8047CC
MAMSADDYREQLSALLPQGLAWPRDPDTILQRTLGSFGAGLAKLDTYGDALLDEAWPRSSYGLLADWERVAGLPDECSVLGQTLESRRNAVAAKLAARGGQSPAYFIGIAAQYGHVDATITEFRARRYGRARNGQRFGGWGWQYVWQLNLPAQTVEQRNSGDPFGEYYQVWGDSQLECVINKLKPAHTRVFFTYGGV